MVDGITMRFIINEWTARQLIMNLQLEAAKPKRYSSETNFQFTGDIEGNKELTIELNYKNSRYTLIIRGSLHKYYHDNNACDYQWNELEETITDICKKLHINGFQITGKNKTELVNQLSMKLTKVELGVNCIVGIDDLAMFLADNLIQHKKVPFRQAKHDGLVYECHHENYYWKIYPKGENLLRVEIVFLLTELKKYKIDIIQDLTKEKLRPLVVKIKKEFPEIVFADGIPIFTCEGLSKKEELALLRFTDEWRNKDYKKVIREEKNLRKKKNHQQGLWRLNVRAKKIFIDKGAGYKEIVVEVVTKKIDSYLI